MRVLKEGEKGRAICNECRLTTTTYMLRDVEFSNKRGTVKNIIVGVCDKCNEVASIPSQSVPQIKLAKDFLKLPLEEQEKILKEQAKEMAKFYEVVEDNQELLDY